MIAITGHASGIGQALFKKYPGSLGFDLANGYDIDRDIDLIIDESKNCNIFINNAYYLNCQTDLLSAWVDAHKQDKFIIINISSMIADLNLDVGKEFPTLLEYATHKRNLNKLSFDVNNLGYCCKSVNIMLSLVDTNFKILDDSPVDNHGYIDKKAVPIASNRLIKVDEVVKHIEYAIQSFSQQSFISSLSILNL